MNRLKKALSALVIYFVTAVCIGLPLMGMFINKKYWILTILWIPATILIFRSIKRFGQNSLQSVFLLASIIGFSFWFAFGLFESGTLDLITLALGVLASIVVGLASGFVMLLFSYVVLKIRKFRHKLETGRFS
jgi:hypothetical protein